MVLAMGVLYFGFKIISLYSLFFHVPLVRKIMVSSLSVYGKKMHADVPVQAEMMGLIWISEK